MKIFLFTILLLLNNYLLSENLKYKGTDDKEEDANYYTLVYPEDCKKILEIKENKNYEFKERAGLNKIFTQCNIYVKGKNIKDGIKAGSGAVVKTGVKVKEGLKVGTGKLSESVTKETEYFIDDTIKLKDGIVKGTGKILDTTIAKGAQVKDGVSAFIKGIFSSSN